MIKSLLASLVLLMVAGVARAETPSPTRVPVSFSAVYAPLGFDSNDNAQIVAEGAFSNSCYRPGPVDVNVDQKKKIIKLTAAAYKYDGMCLQIIVPFDRVIDLGILRPGDYTIVQAGNNDKLEILKVAQTTSRNADDYIYAPISQAFMRMKNGLPEIEINGDFSNSCMRLVEVKTMVQPKVIVVQPIAAMDEGTDCQKGRFPFSRIFTLENAPKGHYLLHVRSMNAKAVNTLVDIE